MGNITQKMWDELNEKYEQVKLNEEMYRVAMGLTDHTISVVDIPNRTLNQIYNEGDWTGVAVSMADAPESIIATGIIHPDDCDGYRKFYEDIYSGVPKGEYIMRTMEENRGWVWFKMIYQTTFDENNKPLRAICFSDDITVIKRAEAQYKQYRDIVTSEADFIWEANLTLDCMIEEDKAFDKVFNYQQRTSYSEIANIAFSNIKDPLQKRLVKDTFSREALIDAFNHAKRIVELDYEFDYKDGRGMRWLHSVGHLMTNHKEEITVIVAVNDITDIRNEKAMLMEKAEKDPLTGLYNRNAMTTRAQNYLENNENGYCGFVMFDIDNFKSCNDTYGHAYGDKVLKTVAKGMHRIFRKDDVLCRLGGDEFVVFMIGVSDQSVVENRGHALIDEIKRMSEDDDYEFIISISVGATIALPGEKIADIYERTDAALYESKGKGKGILTFS